MAKTNGFGVPGLFPTDPDLKIRICGSPQIDTHLHQRTHSFSIQNLEGVVVKYSSFGVEREKFIFGIFPGEGISRLRQVVSAKREELRKMGKVTRPCAGANRFDHGSELEA